MVLLPPVASMCPLGVCHPLSSRTLPPMPHTGRGAAGPAGLTAATPVGERTGACAAIGIAVTKQPAAAQRRPRMFMPSSS